MKNTHNFGNVSYLFALEDFLYPFYFILCEWIFNNDVQHKNVFFQYLPASIFLLFFSSNTIISLSFLYFTLLPSELRRWLFLPRYSRHLRHRYFFTSIYSTHVQNYFYPNGLKNDRNFYGKYTRDQVLQQNEWSKYRDEKKSRRDIEISGKYGSESLFSVNCVTITVV